MTTVIDLMIIWIVFSWAFFLIVFWFEEHWSIRYLSCLMFIALSVFMILYGIDDTNNWLTRSLGFVHLGVGLIGMVVEGFSVWGNKGGEE